MHSNKDVYPSIKKLYLFAELLGNYKEVYVTAKQAYGAEEQLLHSSEELAELSAALLKYRKRKGDDKALDEVASEFTDVLIQMAIILENVPISDRVFTLLPVKMKKAYDKCSEVLGEK